MNEAIERARKYLGKGEYFELIDEEGNVDKFLMLPISFEDMPLQWELQARIRDKIWKKRKEQGIKMGEELNQEETAMILSTLDKESFSILLDLCYSSIKDSKDFDGLNEEEKKSFVSSNVSAMMPKLFEINDFGESRMATDIEAIKRKKHIQQLRENNASKKGEGA